MTSDPDPGAEQIVVPTANTNDEGNLDVTGAVPPHRRLGQVTRRTWVLAGSVCLVAAIVAGSIVLNAGTDPITPAAQGRPTTAKVEQRTLSAMVSLPGTLTYQAGPDGSPLSVINQTQGTYTALPQPGQVVAQGQVLYRVNASPVVLLYGSTPAYRTLSAGSSGPDVAELNSDLVALGYASSNQLSPTSVYFGSATAMAVAKLQGALGVTRSGTLILGQALFDPTAVRIATLAVPLGGTAQSGQTVMEATSTTRQVEVAVNASQQSQVEPGNKVNITLPDNQTTPGVVSTVGVIATCPASSSSGGSTASSVTAGTATCSSGSSGSVVTPTVTASVTPSDPIATGTWDQAPVQVTITTASVPDALVVPVTALLARSGGSYAVEVVDLQGGHHLVTVSLGLFDDADGLVQITNSKLAAGQDVVVPST